MEPILLFFDLNKMSKHHLSDEQLIPFGKGGKAFHGIVIYLQLLAATMLRCTRIEPTLIGMFTARSILT